MIKALAEIEPGVCIETLIEPIEDNWEEFVRDVIREYLFYLQRGIFGPPTLKQLENAGILHLFLEQPYKE